MKRNSQGRIDLSLDGLVTATKPLPSQPAAIEANREVSRVAEPIAATRFEGLDPFTLSLIEQNPIVPRVEPKPSAPAKTQAQSAQAESQTQKTGSGSLDGLFMMLGAALATGAGGLALAKAKPTQGPTMPAPQMGMSSPAPAFHIPTR